jgi:hypothetical protein
MNFIGWLLTISIVLTIMIESVSFYHATVCRQKAWLKSTEFMTRALLTTAKGQEQSFNAHCSLHVRRTNHSVSWRRLPNLKSHAFILRLQGKL